MPRQNKVIVPKPREKRDNSLWRLLGMRDVNPADNKYWQVVRNKITEVAGLYGFGNLDVPILESFSLLKKSPHLSELYVIGQGRSDRITLRPDLTTGLQRAFWENDMANLPQPIKVYSIGPVFRQVKVQSGHYRQFNQFAFETFNDSKPVADAFAIYLAYNFFKELQLDVQVQINSVGDLECQKEYINKLSKALREKARKVKPCPECRKQMLKNPLRLLSCKETVCEEIRREAPQISNYLSEASNKHFTKVLEYLDELGVNYNFNPFLVKKPGYYNEIIFEILSVNSDGALDDKLPLAAGGRYDKPVESPTISAIPMVGFAGGMERTVMKMKEKNLIFKKEEDLIFMAQLGDQARTRGLIIFNELHKAGFNLRQSFTVDSLREQLEEAKNLGAKIVLILGKKEVATETILVREVEPGAQEIIAQKDLKTRLKKMLGKTI